MNHDLEIDAGDVRECASGVGRTAARAVDGAVNVPEAVTAPHWATSDAATLAADAARKRLSGVGADIAATARQIVATVLEYEAADERTADRLRGAR
jgi:hypothetical protein